MLNNVGLPGLVLILIILLVVVLPIRWIIRSSKRKAREQARVADALEEISKSLKNKE